MVRGYHGSYANIRLRRYELYHAKTVKSTTCNRPSYLEYAYRLNGEQTALRRSFYILTERALRAISPSPQAFNHAAPAKDSSFSSGNLFEFDVAKFRCRGRPNLNRLPSSRKQPARGLIIGALKFFDDERASDVAAAL